MRKRLTIFSMSLSLIFIPLPEARASMFGEENITLAQILVQAIKQLYELEQIVKNGQDSLNLIRDLNRGISDSLKVLDSLGPYMDPGTYKEFKKVENIVAHLRSVYGEVSPSPNKAAEQDTDQVVAEAISLNNSLYDYTKELDKIGEDIKNFSHEVSPGGAQKLTAQSLGVVVHVMNQQIRAQATGLKLQAQGLAIQNKKDKETTTEYLKQADALGSAMKAQQVKFTFPRF
jgi:hypothetical protein